MKLVVSCIHSVSCLKKYLLCNLSYEYTTWTVFEKYPEENGQLRTEVNKSH